MAVTKYLDKTGLTYFWGKIKTWCNNLFALDSAVVHKTGDETINGDKTLNDTMIFRKGRTTADGSSFCHLQGEMATNDYWQIRAGATSSDNGFLEIRTGDNGIEPIYVKQYNSSAGSERTLTLLDASGNSVFPGSITATTPATSDNSTKVATTAFVKAQEYVTENNKVRQISGTGNTDRPILVRYNAEDASETANYAVYNDNITVNTYSGILTNLGAHVLKNLDVTKGTNPNETRYWTLTFCDKDGGNYTNNCIGMFETSLNSSGVVKTYMRAMKNAAATATPCDLAVIYDTANNTGYTQAPTPATSDNSTKIATTAYVKAQNYITASSNITGTAANVTGVVAVANGGTGSSTKNFVDLSNAQTINGAKTFTSRITLNGPMSGRGIEYVANTLTKDAAPSSDQGMYIYFIDKNGYSTSQNNVFGAIGIRQWTSGAVTTRLVGYSNNSSSNIYAGMNIGVDANNVPYVNCTSTSSSRNDGGDVVTRDWIPNDTRIVHPTGAETISGTKTFSANQKFSADGIFKSSATAYLEIAGGSAINKGSRIVLYGESHTSNAGFFDIRASASATKSLIGKPDGTLTWNGQTVSTSSDERIKTSLNLVSEDILDVWDDVQWGEFKFLDAISEKGELARLHTGLIAQAVNRVFKAKNLDICKYGMLCHEEDKESNTDLWTVRYTEALAMEAAYQRRKNKILENRISELENQLSSVLQILKELKGVRS